MAKEFYKKELSDKILGMVFNVHSILGPGLLESAYEGAMAVELKLAGIPFTRQKVYPLYYKGEHIGGYISDLVIDNSIIMELKSVKQLNPSMAAQTINYLKISGIQIGYLINFHNSSVVWRRFVCNLPPR